LLRKIQVQESLHLQHTRHQLSLDGTGLCGLDVNSVNSSGDYFAYLCIPASETTLHQKRMSIADCSHLQQQTEETNCKNELCQLDHTAARHAWITIVSLGLSFSTFVALLALNFDTPVS
jgi:hypothetical protein